MLGLLLSVCPATACQVSDDGSVELARATEDAKAAENNYQTVKRLNEQGSASQRRLRRAELKRDLTSLELSTMLDSALERKNQLLKAKLILRFREQELKVIGDLYKLRSESQLSYRRAIAARDIAKSSLDLLTSSTETQRKLQLIQIAKSNYDLARSEYEIAKRLFESGAINQSRFDRASSNLKIAMTELESRKKSLGARAVQVRQ